MRIGIDISQIVYEGTGVARFTRGLVETIANYESKNEWIFFLSSFRKKSDRQIINLLTKKGFSIKTYPFPPSVLSYMWNDIHMMNIENFIGKLDWFITSDWTEPPALTKKATVVHDLTFMRYPETVDSKIIVVQKKRLNLVKQESNLIFADSQSTKDDLISYLKIEDKKIMVNYPGVHTEKQSDTYVNNVLKKYDLNKKFILSVGKLEPRKNLKRLIEAFTTLPPNDMQLAIVGPAGWDEETQKQYKDINTIHWLGFVPDQDLFALYQSAHFFIFPSIWEGFGYPAIEAMQLGCPTAISNTSSLAELGKNVSYLFDPWDVDSIKEALTTMINNDTLRKDLIAKGSNYAKSFTWKRYFDTMINTLQSAN